MWNGLLEDLFKMIWSWISPSIGGSKLQDPFQSLHVLLIDQLIKNQLLDFTKLLSKCVLYVRAAACVCYAKKSHMKINWKSSIQTWNNDRHEHSDRPATTIYEFYQKFCKWTQYFAIPNLESFVFWNCETSIFSKSTGVLRYKTSRYQYHFGSTILHLRNNTLFQAYN